MARELTDPTLELLEEFTFAWLRGDSPDPREFLDRAPADERADLSALIDRFLVAQPSRAPTEETLSYVREIAAGTEPEVRRTAIEKLRLARGLSIEAVVDRLRAALGLGTPLAGRLREAYSDLERDWLDPRGVRHPVWTALAGIFEVDVRANWSWPDPEPPVGDRAFAARDRRGRACRARIRSRAPRARRSRRALPLAPRNSPRRGYCDRHPAARSGRPRAGPSRDRPQRRAPSRAKARR